MRGAVLRNVGEPLEIRDDVELDEPGPGEVHVITASGICHPDLSLQSGIIPHPMPRAAAMQRGEPIPTVVEYQ
jgi:Zn-dependent alcohol dehydrogenase